MLALQKLNEYSHKMFNTNFPYNNKYGDLL